MKVYLVRKNTGVDTKGEFDVDTNHLTVLKGSKISSEISKSEKFRGAGTIEKYRQQFTKNYVVVEDVEFKSSSTAANFVTGISTNGLIAWKTEDGKTIKSIMTCNQEE